MKNLIKLSFFILLISCSNNLVYENNIENDIRYLADDKLEGRETGTAGEKAAAEYIASRFINLKVSAKGTDKYYQDFYFKNSTNPHEEIKFENKQEGKQINARNVIGFINNNSSNTIVIGAHYDHLGYGDDDSSLYRGEDRLIHNGADDNASGTALMLDLANKLVMQKLENNYMFIAFSGEEMGLLGSNYFLKNPTISKESINYMINLDMVGRLSEEKKLSVSGIGSSSLFKQTVKSNNKSFDLIEFDTSSTSRFSSSDHASFYYEDIPVLNFFTGQHEDYHKPSDDYEKINYSGIKEISDYIFDIIIDLDDNNKLSFKKVEEKEEETPRFRVSLGVMPDYLYNSGGMRISAVTSEDKPAAKAGLKKGDIVVKMGEYDIIDMMSYMRALSEFNSGDSTIIIIKRGEDLIKKSVSF